MKQLVSFDAAGTLVDVKWKPAQFACDCATDLGIELPSEAGPTYDRLLRSRWASYCEINQMRDPEQGDEFWRQLTYDWLAELKLDLARTDEVIGFGRERLYGPNSPVFSLFPDTVPALDAVAAAGVPMVVTSNWDYSLHRILRGLGIYERFEKVYASLEEGPEKPDPRFFNLVLSGAGVDAHNALHVGDDPVDDLQGAKGVGMTAALIDRSRTDVERPYISRLTDTLLALEW